MSKSTGPEADVLVWLLDQEDKHGGSEVDDPNRGLLVHEERRVRRVVDDRAMEIVARYDNPSRFPHHGQHRLHNALRGLGSKNLVRREQAFGANEDGVQVALEGQYRYFLTEVGRKCILRRIPRQQLLARAG